jgi:hypothetical protein
MNRKALATICAAALLITGCGIDGKWSLSSVDPTAAWRDFEYQSLILQRDGTFHGEALEFGDQIRATSDTYTYDDGTLQLVAHDGEIHAYDTRMHGANELVLKRNRDGRKVAATFHRKPQRALAQPLD